MKFGTLMMATMLSLSGVTAAGAQDAVPAKQPAEKKVCRAAQVETGSIISGKRVCHTKTEWAQIDAANQQATDQALRQRNAQGSRGSSF